MAFWLKTSRPGLWFPTIWLYLLPLGGSSLWQSPSFWFGLMFVTFPLNVVVYGVNDLVDAATDRVNPRKDSWVFGARGSDAQLRRLPSLVASVSLVSTVLLVVVGGPEILLGVLALGLTLYAYNHPSRGLRGRPPWELVCQGAYLLVVPLSIVLNRVPWLPATTWVYLGLFTLQSHLIGEVMDIEPDRNAGRRTTATVLGPIRTKILIAVAVAVEALLLVVVYQDYYFGGALALLLSWLGLDVTWLFRARPYTLAQMRVFGVGANALAVLSMGYVWWSGCLLSVP